MAEIVPGIALPDAMGVMTQLNTALGVIFALMIMGGIFFIIWKKKLFFRFPTNVDIFQLKSGALQLVDTDSARRVKKKDGEIYYDFKKRNIKWKPPTFESLIQGKRGTSKLYLKELSQDSFEVIDPRSFVTADADEYRTASNEELDKFYKNVQDDKADLKWNKVSAWEKLLPIITVAVPLIMIGVLIFITMNYGILPILDRTSGAGYESMNKANDLLNMSITMMDRTMRYMDAVGIHVNVNGTTVIP